MRAPDLIGQAARAGFDAYGFRVGFSSVRIFFSMDNTLMPATTVAGTQRFIL